MSDKNASFLNKFLSNKKAVICDKSSQGRVSIRKFLSQSGLDSFQIEQVDNFDAACDYIEKQKPDIVFCDYKLNENVFNELFQVFTKNVADRSNSAFIVVASEKRQTWQSDLLDSEIDGFLFKPYTTNELKECFLDAIKEKLKPSKYYQFLTQGRDFFHQGDFDSAEQSLNNAIKLTAKPIQARALLARTLNRLGRLDDAYQNILSCLQYDPNDYPALRLKLIMDCEAKEYDEAEQAMISLEENYQFLPNLLPYFLRVNIAKGQFQKIYDSYIRLSSEDEIRENLKPFFATGLIFAGKGFIDSIEEPMGVKCLEAAALCSAGNQKLIQKIMSVLLKANLKDEADKLMSEVSERGLLSKNELQLMELEVCSSLFDPAQVIQMADGLIKQGLAEPKTWEILIGKSREMGRKKEMIDELVLDAQKAFPKHQFK